MARTNFTKKNHYSKNKKGLSVVVATMLLVALTVVAAGIVWTITQKFVEDETNGAKECFDVLDKVSFNDEYVCYDMRNSVNELQFSINIKDADVDKVLIVIFSPGQSRQIA